MPVQRVDFITADVAKSQGRIIRSKARPRTETLRAWAFKVKVPFDSSVGTQKFPPEEYSLQGPPSESDLAWNQAGQGSTTIGTNSVESAQTQESVKLVFDEYAGQYFLAQIWEAGDNIGRELAKSRVEIEMAMKYAPGQQVALRPVAHR